MDIKQRAGDCAREVVQEISDRVQETFGREIGKDSILDMALRVKIQEVVQRFIAEGVTAGTANRSTAQEKRHLAAVILSGHQVRLPVTDEQIGEALAAANKLIERTE